jgi:hypothetical protein
VTARRARAVVASAALAAAQLLGGCTVDVEGAPCSAAGATADCPGGQACGNDLRCSVRALACESSGSRCTPDATYCSTTLPATAVRCDRAADPVCGKWITDDCGARAMECGTRGSGACECPEYVGTTVVADPGGSPSRDRVPFPRGQAWPRECSFGRLADALFAVSTAPVGTVKVAGDAGAPAVFGTATGEPRPLVVPANVTVLAAAAPAGPTVIRGGPDPDSVGTLVRVLGALDGVRIEAGGSQGAGIEVGCGGSGVPWLHAVRVDGGGIFDATGAGSVTGGLRAGISVTSTCGARLQHVDASAVSGPALSVEPGSAGTVLVSGGSFGGSETGIWLRGGTTTIAPDGSYGVTVSGNAGEGIVVGAAVEENGPLRTVPGATLDHVVVTANGGVGILIRRIVEPGSRVVRLVGCDVSANGRTQQRVSGNLSHARRVGGALVVLANPATLDFRGNRLWSNAGDQLAFESSDASSWTIGPSVCGPDTNVFACMEANVQRAIHIYTLNLTGRVNAPNNRWPGGAIGPYQDYIVPPEVVVVPDNAYCGADPGVPDMPACIP